MHFLTVGLSRDDRTGIIVMPGKLGLAYVMEVQLLWHIMVSTMRYTFYHASVKDLSSTCLRKTRTR